MIGILFYLVFVYSVVFLSAPLARAPILLEFSKQYLMLTGQQMKTALEKVDLWQRTLGKIDSDSSKELERLRSSFFVFHRRVGHLLQKISAALPGLTVHDLTHTDALWETADLIVGNKYPINPLEAYVLAGAFLLHDAALCFEAYEGGRSALRNTVQWKDALSAELDKDAKLPKLEAEEAADFAALRLLHAEQAAILVTRQWEDPDTNEPIFLIDDVDLRKRLGPAIGQIAASHGWNIEDVHSRLPSQINAPGDWPVAWRIDPVKLACILRCADALHIDNRRAPDFLHALLRRSGISYQHWKAQNWLARADLDQSDQLRETALITSNKSFERQDADAWWIAYDAIQLADSELTQSNALLASRPQHSISPEFAVKRIAGAASPEALSTRLRTTGWEPWSAKLHVSNVERLVKNLGGENLYGRNTDQLGTVLRELIQNSRDAIAARRELDKDYDGKIRICVSMPGGNPIIRIIDDGIGMSKRVLTGPLLDFGTSFWRTELMKEEFPGLRSSNFRSVGRFGIGFYAVFMASDHVGISSRRWDRGLDTVCSVEFPKGLTLRPLFSEGSSSDFKAAASSQITFKLNDYYADKILTRSVTSNTLGVDNAEVPLANYLRVLACGLDCRIELQIGDSEAETVHVPIEETIADTSRHVDWLSQISFSGYKDETVKRSVVATATRLRPLRQGKRLLGFAALNDCTDTPESLPGIRTIGGLTSHISLRGGNGFVGIIENEPASAKRDVSALALPRDTLEAWAAEQLELLKVSAQPAEWLAITNNLASLDLDPTPVFTVLMYVAGRPVLANLSQVLELVKTHKIAVFKSPGLNHIDSYAQQTMYNDFPTFRPVANSQFLSLESAAEIPKHLNSFIGCIYREAKRLGRSLVFETHPGVSRGMFGLADVVLIGSVT